MGWIPLSIYETVSKVVACLSGVNDYSLVHTIISIIGQSPLLLELVGNLRFTLTRTPYLNKHIFEFSDRPLPVFTRHTPREFKMVTHLETLHWRQSPNWTEFLRRVAFTYKIPRPAVQIHSHPSFLFLSLSLSLDTQPDRKIQSFSFQLHFPLLIMSLTPL